MVEAATNVVVGYVLAIATQIVVFPWFGIETGLAEHLDHFRLLGARARCARLGFGIGLGRSVLRGLRSWRLVGARGRAVAAVRLDTDGGEARVADVQENGVAVLVVAPDPVERDVGLGLAVGRGLGDQPAPKQRADHLGGGAAAESVEDHLRLRAIPD